MLKRQKRSGKWEYEKYLKELRSKNHLSILDNIESYLLDAVNTSNSGYVSEHGDVERWVGGVNKEKFVKEIKKGAQETRKKIKKEINNND